MEQEQERKYQALRALGYSGQYQEMFYNYLKALGYTGHIQNMTIDWIAATGGVFIPPGPTHNISITAGRGYSNSTYTSDKPGQWTADGVAITGETGTTYRMTADNEGKVIRCAYSNGIQMWVPTLLPASVKEGAALWIPDLMAEVVDGKLARVPNILNPGWADQVQATASMRSPAVVVDGRLALSNPITEGGFDLGLVCTHSMVMKHMWQLARYKDGTVWVQGGRYPALAGSRVRNTESRIHGRSGSNNLELNVAFRPLVVQKAGVILPAEAGNNAFHPNVFPIDKATISMVAETPPTYFPVMGMGDSDVSGWAGPEWVRGNFPSELSVQHTQFLDGYFRHRWNAQALPPEHPYRNTPPRFDYVT